MNKRGQFYLIAAVVIIAIIIGFVSISNYSKRKTEYETIYGLDESLRIESAKLIDYGIYSGIDEVNLTGLLEQFTKAYSQYAELDKLYFIFGNSSKVTVAGYHDVEDGQISLVLQGKDFGGEDYTTNPIIVKINRSDYVTEELPALNNNLDEIKSVVVTVGGIDYGFNLKPGENFYFILVVNMKGEQYIVTNQDEQ